jgi:hypothetical protein
MKLTIDNLDGRGPSDYTTYIDNARKPQLVRRLNKPSELQVSLVASAPDFVVPTNGARVMLGRSNGQDVFTGYVIATPKYEYLGWGDHGPIFRYNVTARSDEVLLDHKTIRRRHPFVNRSAGNALRQLVEDLAPGTFDTTQIQDLDTMPLYSCDPQKRWSEHAWEIAMRARGNYRALNGGLTFESIGSRVYALNESAPDFSPEGLRLEATDGLVNDVTVVGRIEPQAHVKDYFVGDGYSLKFYLSQPPFMGANRTMLDEEYASLDPVRWSLNDPQHVVSVNGGKLTVAGGTGIDGETRISFAEKIELCGTVLLQHGDVVFDSASTAIMGGLYSGTTTAASCWAGFQITPFGTQCRIQALLGGALTGPLITTHIGYRYVFTTRLYSSEAYREQQVFHSSTHPAGTARGGAEVSADVRIVLEVHEIDPANPATLVAASTVLYDGVVANAPGFCTYTPVSARDMHCTIAFTRIIRAANAEVRSALPGQSFRTRLAGSLSEGAECRVSTEPALQFFPQTMPAPNELIEARYRGSGRALARVTNPASIASAARNGDDGVRGVVRNVKSPSPRTSADCEQSALAILDDGTGSAWSGEYGTWSDFLPGAAEDIFPGDALDVNLPTQNAIFRGIVREVAIEFPDLASDHSRYQIHFCEDNAWSLAMDFDAGRVADALDLRSTPMTDIGAGYLADLTGAEIVPMPTSTSVTIDAGLQPISGGGVEVRWNDFGWGRDNDRNLVGRFASRTFTVPRLGRVQGYYLRQYDNSSPPKYSRYSAALHLDYPL